MLIHCSETYSCVCLPQSATLLRLVQQKAEKYQAVQGHGKKFQPSEKPNLSLPFVDFEQVLYGYQLQGRLDLLEGFRRAFEELDTERVGVVNRVRKRVKVSCAVLKSLTENLVTCSHGSSHLLGN